jgi:DNA-binding transcriptional ArsR family regulator
MEILTQLDPDFQLDTTAQLFKALAEPARLRILNLLVHGGELAISRWKRSQVTEILKFPAISSSSNTRV